jgi:hypothetical protein
MGYYSNIFELYLWHPPKEEKGNELFLKWCQEIANKVLMMCLQYNEAIKFNGGNGRG